METFEILKLLPLPLVNPKQLFSTFVGADSDGNIIGITVYNCSPIFGFIIGDSFAIPEPKVIEIKVCVYFTHKTVFNESTEN